MGRRDLNPQSHGSEPSVLPVTPLPKMVTLGGHPSSLLFSCHAQPLSWELVMAPGIEPDMFRGRVGYSHPGTPVPRYHQRKSPVPFGPGLTWVLWIELT